jgi:hypothetical protein
MGLTQTAEFISALSRAGFDADLAQQIITDRGNKMALAMHAALFGEQADPRFTLVTTLDIVVPVDYVHATQLSKFKREHEKKCYYWNEAITDGNFSKVTTKLAPRRKFKVKVFRQTASGTTTSEGRMAFLRSQKAVFTGAQGASLVFAQKRLELPKRYWYCSFDEKEALFQDADGCHGVPLVLAVSGGGFDLDLGSFEEPWDGDCCLLCFCDE